MMNVGKCPNCAKIVNRVNIEAVDVVASIATKWRGVSFVCPYCRTVLGVGINPFAIKAETVQEVVGKLKRG